MPLARNVHDLSSDVVKRYPDEVPESRANQDLLQLGKANDLARTWKGKVTKNLTCA